LNRSTVWLRGFVILGAMALILASPGRVAAQRAPFPIPDPDPEIERKSFIVADGFEVNLFAADPIIAKPLQMNFDPAGRLWIASSEVYPQIKPGQVANDKVLIVEDRDGDGRADKTSVFAGGLLIPTGIEPGDGGAYVANSTELLHLKDTDGDGKADQTRVVLSGFGTEDTHHILHTLRWGYDGMLYFNQSVYIHSHIETPHGVRRLAGGGIWQFRPDSMQLDVFIRGLVNPWGHHFDRWGQSFATDGAGGEGINYCIPGASYYWAVDAVRVLKGLNPGSPKYCGLEVVSGRHMPDAWQGNLLTNDFRGNRVCRFVLSDDGAGFAAREQSELIKTRHVAFRPIDIKMGPDGAIYIADWYNPIIQHGEVDFRDPRRDHTRGRIWRVTAKGRPLVSRPKLVGSPAKELLASLKAPEQWTRQQARRVIQERGKAEFIAPLIEWTGSLDSKDPDYENDRLEALWTFQALDHPEPDLLGALLHSADARVRAAAVRVVPHWKAQLADPVALLGERVADEHPRVRLEAARALAQFPNLRSAALAMSGLDRPIDRFLEYALWLTATQLAPSWLPEVQAGRFDFGGRPQRLVFALVAVSSLGTVKPLLALLQAGKVPGAQDESVQTLIATLGQPADLAAVLDLVLTDRSLPGPRRAALLDTLARAAERRKVVPAGDLSRVVPLLSGNDDAMRAAALRAVGAWNVPALQDRLAKLAAGTDTSPAVRAAAIEALARAGKAEGRRVIEALAEHGATTEIEAMALAALLDLDPKAATRRMVGWLGRLSPDRAGDSAIVLARVLERRGIPALLASALEKWPATLPADVAKLCIRQVRASGRDEPALIAALGRAGKLESGTRTLTDPEMARLLADVAKQGDAARGEAIFRRKDLTCLKCHAIAGAGGQVGPGLESIGASAQPDYLIDSLLQPNKQVKENYHAIVVATREGQVYTGIKLRQTDTDLVLRNVEDRELSIPLNSIEEQGQSGSIMPLGLIDGLTRAELIDLIRFLSELGKVGRFAVGTRRVCRRWQVLDAAAEGRDALARGGPEAVLQLDNPLMWRPAYTTVAGLLPLSEWAEYARSPGPTSVALSRTQLQVTTPGKVKLSFNSTEGLRFWIDGRRIEPPRESADALVLDLNTGVHTLGVAVDLTHRREGIRCILDDVPGSPARAQVVLGK
jgi:putative heme-binding domain-containing protein